MSSTQDLEDSDDGMSIHGGDLGLGHGLKPGGMVNVDINNQVEVVLVASDDDDHAGSGIKTDGTGHPVRQTSDHICNNCKNTSYFIIKCDKCRQEEPVEEAPITPPPHPHHLLRRFSNSSPVQTFKRLTRSKSDTDQETEKEIDFQDFPVIDDVPLGTSIRQQKKLYEQNRKELFEQGDEMGELSNHKKQHQEKLLGMKMDHDNSSVIAKKLIAAERDIEILRYELETCKKVSESRCKAMRLFKGHSYAIQTQQIDSAKKTTQLNKALQAEINQLQFELEYKEAAILTSQEMWTGRFQKLSQENFELKAVVSEQTNLIRNLQAEKTARIREQDELIALLDVQERQRYEATRSQSSDDNSDYNNFTSTELAVLGACRCRVHKPQPCGCAHAAAYMKREITKQRLELTSEKQRVEEATIMADAYRIAFEEQLNRNSGLMRRLVDLTSVTYCESSQPNVSKPRAALRWLIKQLNEEDYLPMTMKESQMQLAKVKMNEKALTKKSEGMVSEPETKEDGLNENGGEAAQSQDDENDGSDSKTEERPKRRVAENGQSALLEEDQSCSQPSRSVQSGDETSEDKQNEPRESGDGMRDASRRSSAYSTKSDEVLESARQSNLLDILDSKREDELINMLVDMVKDRTEALAHQRLAARMLAKRLTDVEQKLSMLTGEVYDK